MTDSASGYVHITPLHSKNQWNLMVQELMFAGILGHAELTFRCDKAGYHILTANCQSPKNQSTL